ncbi:hypothetical protein PULV_a0969 [Pseudoalteromonas ulvae UL12]|nr:hypothetical protein [Pseudoalteromonas ulvae UL12]
MIMIMLKLYFDLPYKPNSFDNQKLQRNILDKLNLFES